MPSRRRQSSPSYADLVLATPGLLSWYRLGERSGTVARDSFGLNTGSYEGSPTLGAPGLLSNDGDTAVTLDASTKYVLCKAGRIVSGLASFSIVAWMSSGAVPTADRAIYCERGAAGNDIVKLECELGTGRPKFTYRDTAGTLNQNVALAGTYANNGRHLFAVTKAGTALVLYADGLPVRTATLTASDTFSGTVSSRIGSDQAAATSTFPGTLDEVSLYNRALTAAEISAYWAAGTGRA